MVSYVLCDCKPPEVLRFRNIGLNFLTSGDFADISISKVGALCLNCRAAECLCKGLQKKSEMFDVYHCGTCPDVLNPTFMLNVPSHFIN